MKTLAHLAFAALFCAQAEAQLQIQVQPLEKPAPLRVPAEPRMARIIINGDDGEEEEERNKDRAGGEKGQMLEFSEGSQLHGALISLDGAKKELTWRGQDGAAKIDFPLAQIARLDFGAADKVEVKTRVTVKLIGGDWLAADLLGLRDKQLQLRLGDGTALNVDRSRVEWIYFSKGSAAECYEGPVSFMGWSSQGGWTYREGALRASQPSVVGRTFDALPDRVEYRFEFDQGTSMRAFSVMLHGADPLARNMTQGMLRLMVNGTSLQFWAQTGDNMKQEQVDLTKFFPAPPKALDGAPVKVKPIRWRIFEDHVAGRIVLFMDGRKVGDWNTVKGKAGENRGAFVFQPMSWNANTEQSLSKILVTPWNGFVPEDNAIEDVRPKMDQAVMANGDLKEGEIESVTADKIKVGAALLARDQISLLRFARAGNPPDEDPPAGRVRLAQRGEFDAASLNFRDGRLQARTGFAGELVLPVAALRDIEFSHIAPVPGKPVDTLVFKNGDQLRGSLESAGDGQRLHWRAAAGSPPVEMDTARVAGVVLATRADRPVARLGVLARLRNGDLLSGDFVALERENLVIENGGAGRVTLPRDRVQALYFSSNGALPVVDGASEHEVWESGIDFNRSSAEAKKRRLAEGKPQPSAWSYFDGAFALKKVNSRNNSYNSGTINLGRVIEAMPSRVDFSFDVLLSKKGQFYFTVYLFTEPDNPGYIMQVHQGGMYVYDTGGLARARGGVQQLQVQFGDKIRMDAMQHRARVLADRVTGRVTLLMDGVVMGQFGPRSSAPPRNLARGVGLVQQQNMPVTFANLWVAPWNGQIPGQELPGATAQDSVLLANGDEAQGTIGTGTPEIIQITSEAGTLDLPVNRLTTIDFGGRATEPAGGIRLRLNDRSVLTVSSYRIENGLVSGKNPLIGDIKFPLSALQELVFTPSTPPVVPAKPGEQGPNNPPARILRGGIGVGNGVVVFD
jgi:hypothetical protein